MVPAWLQIVTAAANAILLVALAILVLGAIPALLAVRRQIARGSDQVATVLAAADPILRDATTLLGELRAIAGSVRSDATTVHQFVTDADARAREIGQRAEARLAELDAAFEVLRDGLEDAVVSVAAVAHGVRAGTAALGLTDDGTADDSTADNGAAEADDFIEVGARHNGNDERAGSPGRRAQPRVRGQRREE
jgi:hypothetical protein